MSNNSSLGTNPLFKIQDKSCMKFFVFQEIIEEEVNSCMKCIKPYTAPDTDKILKFVIYANNLIPFLTKLFNKCLHFETFRDTFKKAYVFPILKVSTTKTFSDF